MQAGTEPAVLAALKSEFPLPDGWTVAECFMDQAKIGDLSIRLAGLLARREDGADATGSAAQAVGDPLPRAYFELLERVGLLDAIRFTRSRFPLLSALGECVGACAGSLVFPKNPVGVGWGYSRSNGVAIGRTWREACEAAAFELC